MACFMCKRWKTEPVRKRMKRFTLGEVEPFVTVSYRDAFMNKGTFVAVLGVAIQRPDGEWGLIELRDETIAADPRRNRTIETADPLKSRAAVALRRKMVDSLNRLREHHERLYVFPAGV